jgi:hypothetical protein
MTVADLIRDALQEINAVASGESPSAADQQVALTRLNAMLDLWQTEKLTILNTGRQVYPFIANQQEYGIGPDNAADFVCAVQPVYIDHAGCIWPGGTSSDTEIPITLIGDDEWAEIRIKATSSTLPTKAYYNRSNTLTTGVISFWPVPTDATVSVALYIPTPLTRVTLNQALTLAPAYEEAVRYNLALRCCAPFERAPSAAVAQLAVEAKGAVKRSNPRRDLLKCDDALVGRGVPFNIFTGGT